MKRIIISEAEKKHIKSLYEQNEQGFKQKIKKFFDKLFKRVKNNELEQIGFGCESEATFECPSGSFRGEGEGENAYMDAQIMAEGEWVRKYGQSTTTTSGDKTITKISANISYPDVVRHMRCEDRVIVCLTVGKKPKPLKS